MHAQAGPCAVIRGFDTDASFFVGIGDRKREEAQTVEDVDVWLCS